MAEVVELSELEQVAAAAAELSELEQVAAEVAELSELEQVAAEVAESSELERVAAAAAEFEQVLSDRSVKDSVAVVVAAAEPAAAELGRALVLVGNTGRSADDHTHPAQLRRHIQFEGVAAATAVP